MRKDRGVDIDGYLSKVDSTLHDLVKELRRIILESVPDISEAVKWGNLIYEKNGIVCGIVAYTSHVNLQFWRGAELTDPENLLEGTGKAGGRHVKARNLGDIRVDSLKALVKEAARLNESRQ